MNCQPIREPGCSVMLVRDIWTEQNTLFEYRLLKLRLEEGLWPRFVIGSLGRSVGSLQESVFIQNSV